MHYMEMPKASGIYAIHCATTRMTYIGCSQNVKKRVTVHFHELSCNRHASKQMQADYGNLGEMAFTCYVVELCEVSNMFLREQHYIQRLAQSNKSGMYNKSMTTGVTPGMTNRCERDGYWERYAFACEFKCVYEANLLPSVNGFWTDYLIRLAQEATEKRMFKICNKYSLYEKMCWLVKDKTRKNPETVKKWNLF